MSLVRDEIQPLSQSAESPLTWFSNGSSYLFLPSPPSSSFWWLTSDLAGGLLVIFGVWLVHASLLSLPSSSCGCLCQISSFY